MSEDRVERRLAAILAADVVGYSRLIEADEVRTLAAIKGLRAEGIDPLLARHHGRVVKLMGDGAIVEFGSVVDAVACAVAIQNDVAARQTNVPPERRIVFRIGINLGDIVVEGEDLLGDGVNVAARLEQLCDPGGILISGTAYDHLQGKFDLPLDFTGEQQVKNISRPVRTYRVRVDGAGRNLRLHVRRFRKWTMPAALALILLVGGAGLWLKPWRPSVEVASIDRMALPLPDKPSIAVLPFNNFGDDREQGYFADGMTEDLITDLSKLSGIFVIARNSSWTYKDKPTKPQQVAEELGVRYVLEGSVRRQGDEVRINAQLIDAVGGHHVWAERYDGEIGDVFALQDEVIGQIVAAMAVKLTNAEQKEFEQPETDVPQAYDALLQGWEHLRGSTEEDTLKSIPLFEWAIKLDPNYGRAYAALAAAHWRIAVSNWESANFGFQRAMDAVNENLALALKMPTPLAHSVKAEVLARQGQYEKAFAEISRALALSPNDPEIHISRARILNATGRAPEAEEEARLAMRLDPQYPPAYLRVLAHAQFHQEQYETAVESLKLLLTRQSDVAEDYLTLVSALGHLGRKEGVKEATESFDALTVPAGYSPLTVQEAAWFWYGDMFDYDQVYRDRLQEGLRRAGVTEGAGTDLSYDEYARFVTKVDGAFNVKGARKVDAAEVRRLMAGSATLIDVRSRLGFGKGHVPSAVNLPVVTEFNEQKLSEIVGKNDEVIFSCHGRYCSDSAFAAAKALAWGYSRVYHFAGGFPEWQDAGYQIEVAPTQ